MAEQQPIIIKKKKGHDHGHHGGAWKVAYADFVTAMMAFFMVMWIMGMSEETRAQVAGYFNDPMGFTPNTPMTRTVIPLPGSPNSKIGGPSSGLGARPQSEDAARREMAQARALAREIEQAISREAAQYGEAGRLLMEGVEVDITNEGVELNFIENTGEVFFKLGSAEIRPAARTLIGKLAPLLARSGRDMIIDGHTDSRPFPSSTYDNWDLSGDRAAALRRLFKAGGVTSRQILAVRANADRRLRRPDDPLHFSNRRVSVLLPFEFAAATEKGLPREELSEQVQGMFRRPVEIAP